MTCATSAYQGCIIRVRCLIPGFDDALSSEESWAECPRGGGDRDHAADLPAWRMLILRCALRLPSAEWSLPLLYVSSKKRGRYPAMSTKISNRPRVRDLPQGHSKAVPQSALSKRWSGSRDGGGNLERRLLTQPKRRRRNSSRVPMDYRSFAPPPGLLASPCRSGCRPDRTG